MENPTLIIAKINEPEQAHLILTQNGEIQQFPLLDKVYSIFLDTQSNTFRIQECLNGFSEKPYVSGFNLDFSNSNPIPGGKYKSSFTSIEGKIVLSNQGVGIADIADISIDRETNRSKTDDRFPQEPFLCNFEYIFDPAVSPFEIGIVKALPETLLVCSEEPKLDSGLVLKLTNL